MEEETQQEMDAALWGGYNPITKRCAYQPHKDGGVGQLHLWSRLKAEWASLVTDVIKRSHTQAWMRIWEKEIQEIYGSTLSGRNYEQHMCVQTT